MSAKEKAEELFRVFYNQMGMPLDCEWNDDCYNKFKDRNGLAKACALIAVDEIINECYNWAGGPDNMDWEKKRWDYWQQVKQEIEKL
jgi:hypothetical protein